MKNTTITIDETTLEEARKYAAKMGYSFNAWVKKSSTMQSKDLRISRWKPYLR